MRLASAFNIILLAIALLSCSSQQTNINPVEYPGPNANIDYDIHKYIFFAVDSLVLRVCLNNTNQIDTVYNYGKYLDVPRERPFDLGFDKIRRKIYLGFTNRILSITPGSTTKLDTLLRSSYPNFREITSMRFDGKNNLFLFDCLNSLVFEYDLNQQTISSFFRPSPLFGCTGQASLAADFRSGFLYCQTPKSPYLKGFRRSNPSSVFDYRIFYPNDTLNALGELTNPYFAIGGIEVDYRQGYMYGLYGGNFFYRTKLSDYNKEVSGEILLSIYNQHAYLFRNDPYSGDVEDFLIDFGDNTVYFLTYGYPNFSSLHIRLYKYKIGDNQPFELLFSHYLRDYTIGNSGFIGRVSMAFGE